MNKNKVIYSLSVEDILTVMEDNAILEINLNKDAVNFIQDRIGDIIDWRGAIEFALFEYRNRKEKGK
jgi:hypothetical protein